MTFNIKTFVNDLLKSKGWKAPLIAGVVALLLVGLLDSIFFTLILALLKMVLVLGGLALLVYAGFLAYPLVLKKIQQARTA